MNTPSAALPVAVIGAGPVGMAAAAHLAGRGLDFVVIEAGETSGIRQDERRLGTGAGPRDGRRRRGARGQDQAERDPQTLQAMTSPARLARSRSRSFTSWDLRA